jgi:hypothetical protein
MTKLVSTMRNAVKLASTDLALREGQKVQIQFATNQPEWIEQRKIFVSPVSGAWGDSSILCTFDDVNITDKLEREYEIARSKARLRDMLPPGSTVYTALKTVSRSGMNRRIRCYAAIDKSIEDITYYVARALGYTMNDNGLSVSGCGMDMGYSVVSNLSYALYPQGFQCVGEHCPSNEHSNPPRPKREAGSMHHREAGYAFHHRWL